MLVTIHILMKKNDNIIDKYRTGIHFNILLPDNINTRALIFFFNKIKLNWLELRDSRS